MAPTTIRQILLLVIALGIFLGLLVGFYYSSFPAVAGEESAGSDVLMSCLSGGSCTCPSCLV